MEATITHDMLAREWFSGSSYTGTGTETRLLGATRRNPQFEIGKDIVRDLFKSEWSRISWTSRNIIPEFDNSGQFKGWWPYSYGTLPDNPVEYASNEQIFDAIQAFYLSDNKPRDRQIATRIIALYRDALSEDERILSASLRQFTDFFLAHPDLGLPRITLTPDGTLRVRWIQGAGNFVAIEFTGKPLAKLVAEIPREDELTAQYLSAEPISHIVLYARAIGASFA
jgi:hypothetical protein